MSKKKEIPVVVDSLEPTDFALEVGRNEGVLTWSVERLPIGDLLLAGSVLVERKTLSDFTSSLTEGRLRDQASRMAETGYDCYVLIEGNMEDFGEEKHSNVSKASLIGMAASVTQRHGVPVIPCSTQRDLIDFAVRMGRKAVEPNDADLVRGAAKDANAPQTLRMYAGIEKLGPERARTLFEAYPTIADLLRAPQDDLEDLEGFGPKTAATVYEAIRWPDGERP